MCFTLTHELYQQAWEAETFEMLREIEEALAILSYFKREKQYGKTNGAAAPPHQPLMYRFTRSIDDGQ